MPFGEHPRECEHNNSITGNEHLKLSVMLKPHEESKDP